MPRVRPRLPAILILLALGLPLHGCGGGGDDPNDPDATPTPVVDRASIGYRLLRGVDRLDEPKAGVARLFSSHDRADGSNIDFNKYLRRDPDGSYVMAELNSPGVITRLWMTAWLGSFSGGGGPGFSSGAVLKIYVDGNATPLISVNPNRFFAGELAPFVAPLVGQHSTSKAFFSYVPISFASSVKVTLTDPYPPGARYPNERVFYHVNILDLSGQGTVQPSPVRQADGSLTLSADDQTAYQEAVAQWRDPLGFANQMTQARERAEFAGPVSGTAVLAELTGPGRIRGLRLRTAGISPADLEKVRLRIRWDGEANPSVDISLGTGWGNFFTRGQFSSLLQGSLSDGTLYLRFPMPFRQSARLELASSAAGALPIGGEVFHDKGTQRSDARYLHASLVQQTIPNGKNRFLLAQASGAGHVVGLHLVANASDGNALEGDEFITVDGTVVQKGTGTEDFFNSHWYFSGGLRSLPLNGTTSVGSRIRPQVDTFRFLVPDLVPFGTSMRFELNNVDVAPQSADFRAVAFYYLAR